MKLNIVLLLIIACIFVAQTNGAGIRTASSSSSNSDGYTVSPEDVPMSDIESPLEKEFLFQMQVLRASKPSPRTSGRREAPSVGGAKRRP